MSANNDPYIGVVAVTPSDTVNIAAGGPGTQGIRGFMVNVAGTVSFVAYDGSVGNIVAVAGYPYKIRISRINNTGTAATGITALL